MYKMASYDEPLLNEMEEVKKGDTDDTDIPIPKSIMRRELNLPSLDERSVVKHFTHLSQMNYGIDTGTYPLGSCTMKYNPKILEEVARGDKVGYIHPYQHESTVQGALEIMYNLEKMLCEITGMDAFSLQPIAGAHGEFTGMSIVRAYHENNGEKRNEVILPDSAHGTNPASARMAGFDVVEIPSREGRVDMDALHSVLSKNTAAFMLTNPNTLGIFEKDILEISREVKKVGALLYYDGANLNAIMGKARPGDMGFDIVHLNPHKTFATPHGGGGPGAGPVGVKANLEKFLPVPRTIKDEGYHLDYDRANSVGKMSHFYGNFPVLLKAYTYILLKGCDGLKEATERAVLNANYLMKKLNGNYEVPFGGGRMHEFVISAKRLRKKGIRALDVAKRLIDYGVHPPTIYFPMIVEEAMMIEPTESESKETLDRYADALNAIAEEDAEVVTNAPLNAPIKRVDESKAARSLILKWSDFSP
ncbi:MAG: aminomethyl-transferring glycine dehydrogenase subunit GcvPB [Candidatus Thermoplasmatota archaeon]|nr:aminomethyl-transferring glycine dehydrogenase subunit GcvPB [Candidatus Thermoplasmatota archaeon]